MEITPTQKSKIESVINALETGSAAGNYSTVSIYPDGPRGIKQITYGRSQTTEFSLLPKLIEKYVTAGGRLSEDFKAYNGRIGQKPSMWQNTKFIALLKSAGKDPVMQKTQNDFFDERFYLPAKEWADSNGFTLPISLLVIYDSYIHSGSMRADIRNMFPEHTPENGGNERVWIMQYVEARKNWLLSRKSDILKKTVYRMKCMEYCIDTDNWQLEKPIIANGVAIK